ncbi:hypothetical protein A3194_10825 [Candidatus Thiodiazotropha endoloripes]|uniref:hypothetical protein n=1 Tax=Candidatus Thiodiazotropha endoloripes TaxID=1818881 RepID=UPI00083DB6FC|nr:hypothetical protein [Candidatus Thiodiazotropha endoloripes]ODB89637.1 hypothetical protein A3194_10825 [Candidatus Thiodiazotropha endoloripes]
MDDQVWQLIALAVFATATMIGIFSTKTPGFGKYSTSVVVLCVVVFMASFFLVINQITPQVFSNVLFAVAGYAGGLIKSEKPG